MTTVLPFIPSYLSDFTNFIIERCIEDTHFNLIVFPLFMKYLLPFKNSEECIKKLDIEVEYKTDYKDYTIYFKSLFDYYNLLSQKHTLQNDTIALFDQIVALNDTSDAKSTEGTNPSTISTQKDTTTLDDRQRIIGSIQKKYKEITILDPLIITAAKRFDFVFTWECNDLHLDIENDDSDHKTLIHLCISNMDKPAFSIDLKTIIDDSPELIFQKFVKTICKNFNNPTSFIDAKFWVLSQLFTRL